MFLSKPAKKSFGYAKSIAKYGRLHTFSQIPNGTRMGVIYGNCQAEPLRQLLNSAQDLELTLVKVPPVHLISKGELGLVAKVLTQATVFIHQHVKASYRGLGVGTAELAALLPASATCLAFPVAYFSGLHPFQTYIRNDNGMNETMPVTGYHDLRFLAAAGRGLSTADGIEWLDAYETPAEVLAQITEKSVGQLVRRERSLDVHVSPYLDSSDVHSFYSVNHPSNPLLAAQANQILRLLGVGADVTVPIRPFLGADVSLIDNFVSAANGSSAGGVLARYGGKTFSRGELWAQANAWYCDRPDVVARGMNLHAEKIDLLGLV